MMIQTEADEKARREDPFEERSTKLRGVSSALITRAMHRLDLTCTGSPFVAPGVRE
ncbi:hypothetical protein EDC23_2143 [Thiohalophilus thiocyanatoxydans]|uniref:Uncharacterized protein n=2 Tax=Thiohalophilus thiocyanatoxydans TaxID=381308 RepID=A0A4R8IS38_9GAMM|nr:hypothetical protein EDC23_2143 [Thiohalophilus thiocyanatoxydans]